MLDGVADRERRDLTPQMAVAHYKHPAWGALFGVVWWLVLAALLRLVIFLADYFRNRPTRTSAA